MIEENEMHLKDIETILQVRHKSIPYLISCTPLKKTINNKPPFLLRHLIYSSMVPPRNILAVQDLTFIAEMLFSFH